MIAPENQLTGQKAARGVEASEAVPNQSVSNQSDPNQLGPNKLLQFFSIAALTQVTLALSQVVLLPIQIRVWGHVGTAAWYSAIAVASFTSIADCGLRTAGHPEILRFTKKPNGDDQAREYFRQVWAWLRVLVLAGALLLIGGDILTAHVRHVSYPLWRAVLVVAGSIETMLIIRTVYLDTLDLYRRAELSYFLFSALRLALAAPALLIFRLDALGLAWVFLASSAVGLGVQGWLIRHHVTAVRLFEPVPRKLSPAILALTRHTSAEPCANWMRLSLPVLVISAIAPAVAVTMYVALRATFGAVRATIAQLARVASVEFLQLVSAGREAAAESLLTGFLFLAVLCGTALAGGVVVDNLRILGLWLGHFDRNIFQIVELSFTCSAFFSYQVILLLMFRRGQLAPIARRHWGYVVCSALFAVIALRVGTLPLYLIMLLASELLLALSFVLPMWSSESCIAPRSVRSQASQTALAGSLTVVMLWAAAQWNAGGIFGPFQLVPGIWSALVLIGALILFGALTYARNPNMFRTASVELGISRGPARVADSRLMNSNAQVSR
jgi:hypothetical protein